MTTVSVVKLVVGSVLGILLLWLIGTMAYKVWNYDNLKAQSANAVQSANAQAAAAQTNADTHGQVSQAIPAIRIEVADKRQKVLDNANLPIAAGDLDPVGVDSMRELVAADKAARSAGN